MFRGASPRPLRTACGAALAAAALAPAAATAATPAPGYETFAGCPDRDDIQACQTIDFSAGSIGLGALTLPVEQAVGFVGGASNTDLGSFYVADGGSVLKPVALPIPGGAAALTGDAELGDEAVTATPTLTADPEFTANGIRVQLRFGLGGAGLPESCAIGSAEDPVTFELTNATTQPGEGIEPLTGDPGKADFDILKTIVKSEQVLFVANGYGVPAAAGCGSAIAGSDIGSVDDAINATAQLPASPAVSQTFVRNATVSAAFDRDKVFGR